MGDVSDLACLDHLARQPHSRHEAVVEGAHVLDAGGLDALPGVVRLGRVAPERLLADHVLAGLGGRDRGLSVQVVRTDVVEQLHAIVGDDRVPVRDVLGEPVAARGLGHRLLVAARDGHELRLQRRRPGHVGDLPVGVRVGLAHERVAEHADADRLHPLGAAGLAHRREADLAHQASFANAASNATSDGEKSVRRTNASASGAPHSRSMPESSHSIESGPS